MAVNKYINIVVDSKKAESNVNSLDKSMVGLGKDTDKTTAAMGALSKAAAAVAAAISVRQVIAYADAWTVVNNKLANSVRANEQLADVTQRVFDISQKTRSSIDATADLYAKLERSTKALGLSTQELEEVVTTINKAFVVSGSTPDEAARAITQLGQAFDSGALFAEEFNSVNESGNRLIRALSDSLGLNVKQLKDLGSQGKLTNDVLIKAFRQQSAVIDTEYTKTIETFAQSTQVATQNLTKFIGESTLVQSSVAAFGSTMITASENIDTLVDIATALAVVYAARLSPSLIAAIGSVNALIVAQTRATVTTNALGQRTVVASAQMNAFALASRGAAGALALVGGPVGAIVLVVAGMVSLLAQSRKTSDQMQTFAEETVKAETAIKGLTEAQAKFKLSSIEQELTDASLSMVKLQEEAQRTFDAFTGQLATGRESGLVILKQQADDAQKAVAETEKQILSLAANASALRGRLDSAPAASSTGALVDTAPKSKVDDDYSARYLASLQNDTDSLRNELGNRKLIFELYTQEINQLENDSFAQQRLIAQSRSASETLDAQESLRVTLAKIEEERALLLDNDRISAEARAQLKLELQEQELIAEQEYQFRLTEIAEEGKNARNDITQAEWDASLAIVGTLGNNILSAFQGQSRKMFEVGKALAISDTIINTYSSATKAYDSLASIPYVGPALGAAAAAAAIAGGIANVNRIKSTSFGSGGGGSSSYGGSVGGGAATPAAPSAPASSTVIDFRARPGQSFTADDVRDILGSVEGVTLINNGLENARRLGEI